TLLQLKKELPKMKNVFVWGGDTPDGAHVLDKVASESLYDRLDTHLENTKITTNDIFSICWTSGTEGRAKGVPRSHNEWYASSYSTIDLAEITEKDMIMNPFPMVNMAG